MNEKKVIQINKTALIVSFVIFVIFLILSIIDIAFSRSFVFNSLFYSASVIFGFIFFENVLYKRKNAQIASLKSRLDSWTTISYRVKSAGETVFENYPIGIMFLDENFNIKWVNKFTTELFKANLGDQKLQTVHSKMYEMLARKNKEFVVSIFDRRVKVIYKRYENIVYLYEATREEEIEERLKSSRATVMHINLDNYGYAVSNLDVQDRARINGLFQNEFAKWGERFCMMISNYSDSSYVAILDYHHLNSVLVDEFSILDSIRHISIQHDLAITVSIGVACSEEGYDRLDKRAKNALELSLSRGGDQVVVDIHGEELKYYGGKSNTAAKKSKVRARVIAYDLEAQVKKSSNVLIMGHHHPDVDAIGASFAMLNFALIHVDNVKIVLDKNNCDSTVDKMIKKIEIEHVKLDENIVSPNQAMELITEDTLLICVDYNSQPQAIAPFLIDKASKIAVIDHHRRGLSTIENTVLYYVEPYASSSTELVVELIMFLSKDPNISSFEAIIMMMGIIVDTNNFTYRTGSRTFEVASYLREFGADTLQAQLYLREDFSTNLVKHKLLSNVIMFKDRYAIITSDDTILNRTLIAQVSDMAVEIDNVDAAFTIAKINNNEVAISARSFGEVNVQVIMEQLGGGGHLNNAGAQFTGATIKEVYEQLTKTISNNEMSNKDTKQLLLIRNVKNLGSPGDVIEVGEIAHSYHLRHGNAVDASPQNIRSYEQDKLYNEEKAKIELNDMRNLREKIESNNLIIFVDLDNKQRNKIKKTITTDQILYEYYKQFNILIDNDAVTYRDPLTKLGVYKISVQLHKQVQAYIRVEVKLRT